MGREWGVSAAAAKFVPCRHTSLLSQSPHWLALEPPEHRMMESRRQVAIGVAIGARSLMILILSPPHPLKVDADALG